MTDISKEAETVAAWVTLSLGRRWPLKQPGTVRRLKRFLAARHDVDEETLDDVVKAAVFPGMAGRDLRVSRHAIQRFRERSGSKKRDAQIETKLLEMAALSTEVEIKPEFRLRQMLNNYCEGATYLNSDGWILVVVGGVLSTLHYGEAERWEKVA